MPGDPGINKKLRPIIHLTEADLSTTGNSDFNFLSIFCLIKVTGE